MTRAAPATGSETWPRFGARATECHVLGTELGGGVTLGTTRSGKPIRLQLVDARPVRIVVVSQGWAATVLALRAACLGAAVSIATERPAPWELLVRTVGGSVPFAAVVRPDTRMPDASVAQPTFLLHDGNPAGPEAPAARSPWQTSVHLLYRLDQQAAAFLDAADLVLVPRPAADDIPALLDLLRLPAAIGTQIERMTDAEFLAITRSSASFVVIQTTDTERRVLRGP